MTRATSAVARHRRKKRLFKEVKGYWGDRKNHLRNALDALTRKRQNNFIHRKKKKGDFRRLWIQRINVGARIHGLSYSKLIHGLQLANCEIDRKMLSEMAIHDPAGFGAVAESAKKALEKKA